MPILILSRTRPSLRWERISVSRSIATAASPTAAKEPDKHRCLIGAMSAHGRSPRPQSSGSSAAGKVERLRGLQIDGVLKPRRLLDGKAGWLLAAQDPVEVGGALAELRRRAAG